VIFAVRGESFETCYESGITGLVGTVSVQLIDNLGGITYAPTTVGIIETPANSGVYCKTMIAPLVTGQYSLIWSQDGTFDDDASSVDDLVVESQASPVFPPLPAPTAGGITVGPCNAWATGDAVAACCSAIIGTDSSVFDNAIDQASQLLFSLTGRKFNGSCSKTVRPCRSGCGCFPFQTLMYAGGGSRPLWFPGMYGGGWQWSSGSECGCGCIDKVKLSGYPIREITGVMVDGVLLDPSAYRLEGRYLIATSGHSFPACQDLSKADTEAGTWSITYTYGADPPFTGVAAATELACEIYKACSGDGECALPEGVTRVIRQGITIEKLAFATFSIQSEGRTKVWRTGLPSVDAFLTAENPIGLIRAPVFWAPGSRHRYAPVA
jgi:hypothetical protein